ARAGIVGIEFIEAEVRGEFAVEGVAAALWDGIDDTTQRAAKFSFKTAGLDLNLLNKVHLEAFANATRLYVCGVHAVDQVHVFRIAGAIDLKSVIAGGSAALQRLLARAGSKRDQGLERAALRNIVQDGLLYGDLHLALGGINHGSQAGDFDRLG